MAVFVVLARILPPAELGLFSAAIAIAAFAEIFAEGGAGDAVVQRKEIDPRILSTALAINVITASAAAACLWAGAGAIAAAMATPGLAPILPYIAGSLVLNALGYVPQAVLRRSFAFKWLAIRAFLATAASGGVGIALALLGFGVWSMVAQALVMAAVNAALVWYRAGWRPVAALDRAGAASIARFGSQVFCAKLFDFLASRAIELVIAVQFGVAALAVFIMGTRISAVLMQMLSAVTIDVSLPAFSRLAHDRAALDGAYVAAVQFASGLMLPVFALTAALAPELTQVAFGANGAGSASILAASALLGAVSGVQYINGTVINAVGKPHVTLLVVAARSAAVLAVLTLVTHRNVQGMNLAYVGCLVALSPLSYLTAARYAGVPAGAALRSVWSFVLAGLGAYGAVHALRIALSVSDQSLFGHPVLNLAVLGTTGASAYIASAALLDRAALGQFVARLRGRAARSERR